MDAILSAFQSLQTNRLRTLLTVLGVVIGVASVVLMVSIVEGARRRIVDEFENIGANLIFVLYMPEQSLARGTSFGPRISRQGLSMDDVRAIRRNCDQVSLISPEMRFSARVKTSDTEGDYRVMGVTDEAARVFKVNLARGRGLNRRDIEGWARVCVLGQQVASELFPSGDPIGKEVRIRDLRLRVIGILEKKGRALGENRDEYLYIPLTVMHRCFIGSDLLASVIVKAINPQKVNEAADQIWNQLSIRHANYQDFIVDTQDNMLTAVDNILNMFLFVLGGIGALSLMTGGIGIMNIMLVSVTERTREIGIRRAVGAKQRHIFQQFLIESIALSGFGGVLGLMMGVLLARTINHVMNDRLPTTTPLWAIVLAFGCAATVGIFFGSYPASRAAKLDPIEALRHE